MCRKFDEQVAKFYSAQILLALEYLHKKDIIYRDLKPENVLIDSQGYLKISDFGLSRLNIRQNDAKSICGTPEYLAPEIVYKLPYGKPVDWWTFGSILYELLTGFPPFYSKNRNDLFERIKSTEPKIPSFFSENVTSLIQGLLTKNPAKRLGTEGGAAEIKAHPWFKNVNFEDIINKRIKPPFMPKMGSQFGLQNFDKEFTDMNLISPEVQGKIFKNLEGFSWDDGPITAHNFNEKRQSFDHKRATSNLDPSTGKMNFEPIKEEAEDTKMVEE